MSKTAIFLIILSVVVFSKPSIWCIHDISKINPQSATVYESGNLYKTKLQNTYKTANAVWDSKSETVTLRGLKDEVVAFQLIAEDSLPFTVDDISISGFGKSISTELYLQWFTEVKEPSFNKYHWIFSFGKGWYPGHLIPLNAPDIKKEFALPLKVPDNMNRIPSQKCAAFWIDLHIKPETKGDLYKGKITITLNGKKRKVNLRLKVEPLLVPQQNHSNFIAASQTARYIHIGSPEQLKDLNHIFHAHRIDFLPYQWYVETEDSGKALKIFWDKYIYNEKPHLGSVHFDRDILPYLKGDAYTAKNGYAGPAAGTPPDWVALPLSVGWFKRKGIEYPSQQYNETFIEACNQVALKYNASGITQHRMAFILKADEPKTFDELKVGKDHADLFHDALSPIGFSYSYRMDGVNFHPRGAKRFVKDWTLDSIFTYFNGRTHIWSQIACDYAFPLKDTTIDFLKTRYGGEYWLCHTNTSGEPGIGTYPLDCEAVGVITWPWTLWKYRIDGGMFWEAFFTGNADTLWTNTLPIETARKPDLAIINGDGAMIYPGEFVLNTKRPLPGYRLKLIRRAQQDYEYLYLLTELTGSKAASDSIASSILGKALWDAVPKETEDWDRHKKGLIDPEFNYMKGQWSHNPDDWYKARMVILDAILAAKPKN